VQRLQASPPVRSSMIRGRPGIEDAGPSGQRLVKIGAGRPHHPIESSASAAFSLIAAPTCSLLNHLLLQPKLLILLKIGLATNVDTTADVLMREPVVRFPLVK
jgi:hypothetical protein